MEQTQQLDWDDTALDSDSIDGSQEPVGKLRLFSGAHGPEHDFWIHTGDNIIGRQESCDITLPVQSVSKKHAVIDAEPDCHTIYDCGSLNKTRRCKAVLKPHVRYALANGDLLLFADVACQYFILPLPGETRTAESALPQATAACQQGGVGLLQASHETATLETPEYFDSDDESALVPPTQGNAVNLLVFEKTPAPRRMGYGGVLAKDSDEEDGVENTINRTGKSRGSEESQSPQEAGDLCTSAALSTPNFATVIPESDDECVDTSVVSAPSMHLQYDSDTEADESLAKSESMMKARQDSTATAKAAGSSLKGTERVARGQVKVSEGGANLDSGTVMVGQGDGVTGQRPAPYHLDSDTEDEEELEVSASNASLREKTTVEGRPAQFHVDSDTDVEEEPSTAASKGDPASLKEGRTLCDGTAAVPDPGTTQFNLDSDTDVEEDGDNLLKVTPGLPNIDLGSDTDLEEDVDASSTVRQPLGSGEAAKLDDDTDVEEDPTCPRKATGENRKPDAAQNSDTDEEELFLAGNAAAPKNGIKPDDAQDSDTDVEEDVGTARKSLQKTRGGKECRDAAKKGNAPPSPIPVQGEDDEDTDVDEATEEMSKAESDVEADDGPTMAMQATQCFVTGALGVSRNTDDGNSSAESDMEEPTQAFMFKSPPVKPVPFKKPIVPSPGASVLPLPVCTSSEKEEFSDDDESFAVAETQSFCRGPDLSGICVEEEPTQALFVEDRIERMGPPTSTQKNISSVTNRQNAPVIGHNSSAPEEEDEETTLAEEETQLFYAHSTPVTPGRAIKPLGDPSQDETQPIATYLGLHTGQITPSESFNAGLIQSGAQPLHIRKAPKGQQSTLEQKTTDKDPSLADTAVENSTKHSSPPIPSTVKMGASHASGASLLTNSEPQAQSMDVCQSEEASQTPSLRLCLSEEATQAYRIDVSEDPSEAFDTEPVLHLSSLGDAAQTESSKTAINDGAGAGPARDQEDTTTQPLESDTAEMPPQAAGIQNIQNIPPGMDEASEPGSSDVGKATALVGEPRMEPSAGVKKKQPAPTKRGRKKKVATEVEEETAEPAKEVPALPVQGAATELSDIRLEAREEPPTARGRQARRITATLSTPAKEELVEEVREQDTEPPRDAAGSKGGQKCRPGRGLRRKAAVEESQSETLTGMDTMEAAVTAESPTPNLEATATKDPPAPDVTAPATADVPTTNVEAFPISDRSTTRTPITDVKTTVTGPHSTDPPDAEAASTTRDGGSQVAITPLVQKRNRKRGQAAVATTEPSVAETIPAPLEPEKSGDQNQKKQAAPEAEVNIQQELQSEPALVRGRGRQKKTVSSNVGEKQQELVVAPVEPSAPTRASRSRNAGTEEELRPAATTSGRSRRRVLVEKEEKEEEEAEDQAKEEERSKRTKKPPVLDTNKSAAPLLPSTEATPKHLKEAKAASSRPSSRHGGPLSTGEHVMSDQAVASTTKPMLVGNQAGAPNVVQAITDDLVADTATEQAGTSNKAEEPAVTGIQMGSTNAAATLIPRKETVGNGEEETKDGTSIDAGTRATRNGDTKEAGDQMSTVVTPLATRGFRKKGTRQSVEAAADATVYAPRPSRKRGNVEAAEGEETPAAAPQTSKKRGAMGAGGEEEVAGTGTPTIAPQASRKRGTVKAVAEAAEKAGTPAAVLRASRKRGAVESGEAPTVVLQTSRGRGAIEAGEEVCNLNLSGSSERKKRQTRAASSEGAAIVACEESSSESGMANTTEAAGGQRGNPAEKELAEESNAEQIGNPERERRRARASSNEAIATAEADNSTAKEAGGHRKRQPVKDEAHCSKAEQEGSAKEKKRRMSAASIEQLTPEAAATTGNNQSQAGLENTVRGGRRNQTGEEQDDRANKVNQAGKTEQKRRRNSTASSEGATDAVTTGETGLEGTAPEDGGPGKKQAAPLVTSEVESQPEAQQVRGRQSQQRKSTKRGEAKTTEEQMAAPMAAKDSQSLPSQEEPNSSTASRNDSRGRKKAQQAVSSQESVAPGRRRVQQSSTSSEGKAEDSSVAPAAETPRRKGRAPSLSSSPSVSGENSAPKVMFTGVIDEDGEQVVQRLGGELADSVYECTHLVTDRIRRTVKFLCAVARGIPIVTLDWLEKCGKNKSFLSPSTFLVKDREQELNFNFRLSESLQKARKQRLFEGYEIHVTSSVKPEPEHMKDIIQCSGATFLPKMPREYKDKRVIVSCSADLAKCKPALGVSLPITSSEFILTGILQQLADLDAFRLEGTTANEAGKPRGGKRASVSCSTPPPTTAATKRRR